MESRKRIPWETKQENCYYHSKDMHQTRSPNLIKKSDMKSGQSSQASLYPDISQFLSEDEHSSSSQSGDYSIHDPESRTWVNESTMSDSSNRSLQSSPETQKIKTHPIPPIKQHGPKDGDGRFQEVILFLVLIVLIVMILVYIMSFASNVGVEEQSMTEEAKDLLLERHLKDSIKGLKTKYQGQHDHTWKVIGSAVKAVLKFKKNNPVTQPSVILIAALKEARVATDCLIRELKKMIKELFDEKTPGSVEINGLEKNTPESVLKKLEDAFTNNVRLAVIDHFERVPVVVAQLLHGFCDHENAPYKNVIFLIIIRTELHETVENVSEQLNSDSFVTNYLQTVWDGHLSIDKSSALLSRIANRIVLIGPEKFGYLNDICNL